MNIKQAMLRILAEDDFEKLERIKEFLNLSVMMKSTSEMDAPPKPIDEFVPVTDGVLISEEGLAALKNEEIEMMSKLKNVGFKYYSYDIFNELEDYGELHINIYVSRDTKTWYYGVEVIFQNKQRQHAIENDVAEYGEDNTEYFAKLPFASITSNLDQSYSEYK
jgi:hypothetical protein